MQPNFQPVLSGVDFSAKPMAWTETFFPGLVLTEICHVLRIPCSQIDFNSSFVQLGGHSLSAVQLSSACKWHGLALTVESILLSNSILHLASCVSIKSQSHLASIAVEEPSVAPLITNLEDNSQTLEEFNEIPPSKPDSSNIISSIKSTTAAQNIRDCAPMTEMQLALILGSQKRAGTNVIRVSETYHTRDIQVIKTAWMTVLMSEPIFRTTFELHEGGGYMILQPDASIPCSEIIVRDRKVYDKEIGQEDYDPTINTSLKIITLEQQPDDGNISTIVWRVHHAIIDGFSASLVRRKVQEQAMGISPVPGTPFTKVARELRALQDTSESRSQLFWERKQKEYPSAIGELVLQKPLSQSGSDDNEIMRIETQIPVDQLSARARQAGVSLASMYYSAWAVILSMYTDSDSVVFGIVLSGRNLPLAGVDDTIGPLINTLPLHVSLNTSSSCDEYLRHVFDLIVELGSFQFSRQKDGYKRNFSSALAMECEMANIDLEDILPAEPSSFNITSDIPLSVSICPDGTVRLDYQTRMYTRKDIEQISQLYHRAILGLLEPTFNINRSIESLLSSGSRESILNMGNCNSDATSASSIDDLVTLFESAALKYPDSSAIEKGDQRLTYRELDKKADCISQRMSNLIEPGDVVCVHADRSINWIIAIYGILKAGGVYAPLDSALPAALRESNFHTAGAKLFLVAHEPDKIFRPCSSSPCLSIEELLLEPNYVGITMPGKTRRHLASPSANAYVCFTSGSTGKSKGVVCTHQGLVAFQRDLTVRLFAENGRKICQIMSPAFDGSIHEIFSTLSYGATLILAHSTDPFAHLGLADSAILTPSIGKVLNPDDYPQLRTVYFVGEPVSQNLNDIWATKKETYNMYGPTEGTCGATIKRLLPGENVNIGRPTPSSRVYILDRNQRLVPAGVVGEIYLGGIQVARGYIAQPEESAKRFLADSVTGRDGEKMYQTGDRGFWNIAGEIECLGRNDREIKLRGFRLDLNDLETRIARAIPNLSAVAVTCDEGSLVAMVQPASLEISTVKSIIAQVLPIHAIPKHIISVDNFPLTNAGKLDYLAIPGLIRSATAENISVAAPLTSTTEIAIATTWRQLLNLPTNILITESSNFVDLGGHSILQLLSASRLSNIFGCHVTVKMVIEAVSLQDLAQSIESLVSKCSTNIISTLPALGENKLSPMERTWWDQYEQSQHTGAFNVAFACALEPVGLLDIFKFKTACNVVMARHRILRCRYIENEDGEVQRIYGTEAPQVRLVNNLCLQEEINGQFNLRTMAPIRITISQDYLVICLSHIVCDLTTLQILLREIAACYHGDLLPLAPRDFEDTTIWSHVASPSDLEFWTKHLDCMPASPMSKANMPPGNSFAGTSHICRIPAEMYQRMLKYSEIHKFTLHQMALAAVALALSVDSGSIDEVLGCPHFNRHAEDLETVGLFLEPLPIRLRYPCQTSDSTLSFLQYVRKTSQQALAHAVPWNQLLQHLGSSYHAPGKSLLDWMVTFHDNSHSIDLLLPGTKKLLTLADGSKFKLLCEFCCISSETLLLRLEYATDYFSRVELLKTRNLILEALDCLMTDISVADAMERLYQVRQVECVDNEDGPSYFGRKWSSL